MDNLDSYLEKFVENNDLFSTAYSNSYKVVTGESIETILLVDYAKGLVSPFMFDPWTTPSNKILQQMLTYFESIQEFEKCAVLHKLIKD